MLRGRVAHVTVSRDALVEVLACFEIIARLEAIVCELQPSGDGPEVATALASGLLEELEAAVAEGDDS